MSSTVKHLNLRLPVELHEELREAAEHNRRSLNSEIILRLERSCDELSDPSDFSQSFPPGSLGARLAEERS